MSIRINNLVATLFFGLLSLSFSSSGQVSLLPAPQSVQYGKGKVYIGDDIQFVQQMAGEDHFVKNSLENILGSIKGKKTSKNMPTARIVLKRTGKPDPLPGTDEVAGRKSREYYAMTIKSDQIEITSPSSAGLFYGVQTLRQLIDQDDKGAFVPELILEDWPRMPYRGFMMDMTHMQFPTIEEIKKQIDFMAQWKYNQYYFYSETNIELDGYPLLARHAYFTKQQIQEIIQYGRERFIDIIPNLNLYGHLHDLFKIEHYSDLAATPYGREFKTDHPKVEGVINNWIDQFADLFPTPFFHIGFDETYLIKYEAKRLGIATDDLYLGMLNRTIKRVEQKGKKVMFYADRLQLHQQGIPKVQGDPIVVAWHYFPRPPFENGYDEALIPFYNEKLPVFVQSATLNWLWLYPDTDLAFNNNELLISSAKKVDAKGYIMSAWTDSWSALTRQARPDIVHGAMVSWQENILDKEAFFRKYCEVLYPDSVANLVFAAHLALAESARLTRDLFGNTSNTIFQNPFSNKALEIYVSRKEEIKKARMMSEKAQVYLNIAIRAGIDEITLFSMLTGAKLIDYLTAKHLYAGRIADIHSEFKVQRDKAKFNTMLFETVAFFSSLAVDMHDMVVDSKETFRTAWLNEYTDYRLGIAMARFDDELHYWLQAQKKLRSLATDFAENEQLPELEEILNMDWN